MSRRKVPASAVFRMRTGNGPVGFGAGRSWWPCGKRCLWCSGDRESQTRREWGSGLSRGRGAVIVKGSGEVGVKGVGGGEITGRPLKRGTGGGVLQGSGSGVRAGLYSKAQRSLRMVGPGYGPELGRLLDAEVGGSPGATSVFLVK